MMNIKFMHVVGALESLTTNPGKTVKKEDYQVFCKEFVFDKLQGKTFGEAFCEKFKMNDFFLKGLSDSTAKHHIESLGYIK